MAQSKLIHQKLFHNDTPFKVVIGQYVAPRTFHSSDILERNGSGEYLRREDWDRQRDVEQWLRIPNLADMEAALGCALPEQFEFHVHDHCQIVQNVSGSIVYIVNGEAVLLGEKDILLINASIPHTWMAADHTVCSSVAYYFDALMLNNYCIHFAPYLQVLYSHHFPFLHIQPANPYHAGIQTVIDDMMTAHARQDMGDNAFVHNRAVDLSILLTHMLISAGRLEKSPVRDTTLQRAIEYIADHFCENIIVQDVAAHVGMNPDYFSHYFKKKLGLPCKKFINIKRIEKSAVLLVSSDQNILQIMYDCGFTSTSAFYNAFISYYAMPPAKYRRLFGEKGHAAENHVL